MHAHLQQYCTLKSDVLPCRLESQTGLVVRFVIGHSVKRDQEQALDAESAQHGGFLRLPLKVST